MQAPPRPPPGPTGRKACRRTGRTGARTGARMDPTRVRVACAGWGRVPSSHGRAAASAARPTFKQGMPRQRVLPRPHLQLSQGRMVGVVRGGGRVEPAADAQARLVGRKHFLRRRERTRLPSAPRRRTRLTRGWRSGGAQEAWVGLPATQPPAWRRAAALHRPCTACSHRTCTEWKLRPGCTVNRAMEFQSGASASDGSVAGSACTPGARGYNSRAPPSAACQGSSGSGGVDARRRRGKACAWVRAWCMRKRGPAAAAAVLVVWSGGER